MRADNETELLRTKQKPSRCFRCAAGVWCAFAALTAKTHIFNGGKVQLMYSQKENGIADKLTVILRRNAHTLWPSRQADITHGRQADITRGLHMHLMSRLHAQCVHTGTAVPVRQMCTLPSQAPLQKALPLGLAATSSTQSVCPL